MERDKRSDRPLNRRDQRLLDTYYAWMETAEVRQKLEGYFRDKLSTDRLKVLAVRSIVNSINLMNRGENRFDKKRLEQLGQETDLSYQTLKDLVFDIKALTAARIVFRIHRPKLEGREE